MKKIPLSQGKVALVDDDHAVLSQFVWHYNKGYACRNVKIARGKTATLYMHREILGLIRGDERLADHANGDSLDNRRSNLRVCVDAENMRNRRMQCNNTSGFKGVSWFKKRWRAVIYLNGRQRFLGYYDTPEEAYEVYCLWADMLHGEFANYGGIAA